VGVAVPQWSPPDGPDWPLHGLVRMRRSAVQISRSILIARRRADVFAYVADSCNDPEWCAKVVLVDQTASDRPGPGAHHLVKHRPIPLRPAREMDHFMEAPPNSIVWRDGISHDIDRQLKTLKRSIEQQSLRTPGVARTAPDSAPRNTGVESGDCHRRRPHECVKLV
jgi:hypothetical protein